MKTLFAACLQCMTIFAYGQAKELVIGQAFPYQGLFKFSSSKDSAAISNFKGHRVIIELFGPTCNVCFEALPKVNALQKKYKKDLTFLLIGYDNGKTAAIYQKFKDKLDLQLSVAFDRKLFKAISYEAWPTYIWIDANGLIQAVTVGLEKTNAENLEAFIAGTRLDLITEAKAIPFNSQAPYLLDGNGGEDSSYRLRTVISEWTPGLPFIIPLDMKFRDGRKCINIIGGGIENLYNYAYWGKSLRRPTDSSYGKIWPVLIKDKDENDAKQFCFSIGYHGNRPPNPLPIMQSYLASYFGYDVKVETRQMPYWSFTVDSSKWNMLKAKASTFQGEWDYSGFSFTYTTLKDLIFNLAIVAKDRNTPYLDDSGINDKMDIKVDALVTEPDDLFKALREKGIIVTLRQKPMQVLILSKGKSAATR